VRIKVSSHAAAARLDGFCEYFFFKPGPLELEVELTKAV
jgi:hypothetical protein